MSMQQRPTRFYITQEEEQTVVRSVPMARRVRDLLPPEERGQKTEQAHQGDEKERRSVANRLRAAIQRS
jgi:hypothetical protein